MIGMRAQTNAERQRRWRERQSRNRTSRAAERPFAVWDGEGITLADGSHIYVMLSAKCGDDTITVTDASGIDTVTVFSTLLAFAARHPTAIHVLYGSNYDFNMFLASLSEAELKRVYDQPYARWRQFRIGWRRGKAFYLSSMATGQRVTVYDTVSFFQTSFVKACDSYLKEYSNRDLIVSNKADRNVFKHDDLVRMEQYNLAELDAFEKLMIELRDRLTAVDMMPTRWDGPGAVASTLLKREGVKQHLTQSLPSGVSAAGRYAYAGGRFEVIRFGYVNEPSYQYDLNSAYPAAMGSIPSLAGGRWRRVTKPERESPIPAFSLWKVRATSAYPGLPGPAFCRAINGTVAYPTTVTGWYWGVEVQAMMDYARAGLGGIELQAAYLFEPATDAKPFAFVEPLYYERQALKAVGNGAHVGVKLGLNSLYGKLAQQVGWRDTPSGPKIPAFHQLEYAGYITASCRAQMLRAAMHDPDAVIAFETDAIFSSRPLPLPVSTKLGEWSETVYSELAYVQSGMYFGTKENGETVTKTRGIDRAVPGRPDHEGILTLDRVLQRWQQPRADQRYFDASVTRFIGAGMALRQEWGRWLRWEQTVKRLRLEPSGKRMHLECDSCDNSRGLTLGVWHATECPPLGSSTSHQFPVEWVEPNPKMARLAEERMSGYEIEWEE